MFTYYLLCKIGRGREKKCEISLKGCQLRYRYKRCLKWEHTLSAWRNYRYTSSPCSKACSQLSFYDICLLCWIIFLFSYVVSQESPLGSHRLSVLLGSFCSFQLSFVAFRYSQAKYGHLINVDFSFYFLFFSVKGAEKKYSEVPNKCCFSGLLGKKVFRFDLDAYVFPFMQPGSKLICPNSAHSGEKRRDTERKTASTLWHLSFYAVLLAFLLLCQRLSSCLKKFIGREQNIWKQ